VVKEVNNVAQQAQLQCLETQEESPASLMSLADEHYRQRAYRPIGDLLDHYSPVLIVPLPGNP
jgi:hypothetical protein